MALALALFFSGGANPGTDTAPRLLLSFPEASPGASVVTAINLRSDGGPVSAVQFDMIYDPSVMELTATAGGAIRDAGKDLSIIDVVPGRKRFLIAGLNQHPIADGVLLNLYVNVKPEAAEGAYTVTVSDTSCSDIVGGALILAAEAADLAVRSADAIRLRPDGVVNAASMLPGSVSPGELVTLAGSAIGAGGELRVSFNGIPAPMLSVAPDQVGVAVPYGIAGAEIASVVVESGGNQHASTTVTTAPASPGLFTMNSNGTGQAAAFNQDWTLNGASNPASRGSIVSLFGTGAGLTDPPGIDGLIPESILPRPLLPVAVQIGTLDAEVLFAGGAPGLISGSLQVNCRIPLSAAPGSAVPVVLLVGGAPSQAGVTLAVE